MLDSRLMHRILAVVQQRALDGRPAPTLEDIGRATYCTHKTALRYVRALERGGYLTRTRGVQRSLRIKRWL